MSEFEQLSDDLRRVKRGRANLAEAMQQLDSVSNALKHVSYLDEVVQFVKADIREVKGNLQDFVLSSTFDSEVQNVKMELEGVVINRFEQYARRIEGLVVDKATIQEVEERVRDKARNSQVQKLEFSIQNIVNQLNLFVNSHFESYQAGVKLKLSEKATKEEVENLSRRVDVLEGLWQFQPRIEKLENQIQELLVESSDSESEDNVMNKFEAAEERMFGSITTSKVKPDTTFVAKPRKTLGTIAKELTELTGQFQEYQGKFEQLVIENHKLKETANQQLGEMQYKVEIVSDKTKQVLSDWDSVHVDYQFLKENIDKNVDVAQETMQRIRGMIGEFMKNEKAKQKKIKQIEMGLDKNSQDTEYVKIHLKDKLNECIKSISQYANISEVMQKEIKRMQEKYNLIQQSLHSNVNTLKDEITKTKGPLSNLLNHKYIENEILSEDLRKQQDLLREIMSEFVSALDKTKPEINSRPPTHRENTQRVMEIVKLKQENLRLKTRSMSPKAIFRPGTAVNSTDRALLNQSEDYWRERHSSITRIEPVRQSSRPPTSRPTSRKATPRILQIK